MEFSVRDKRLRLILLAIAALLLIALVVWPRNDDNEPQARPPNPEFPTRTRGVVEKCNFCAERLGTEQKPACVEACECEALTFGNLNDPEDPVRLLLLKELSQRRRPELGTNPHVFYLV